MTDLKQVYKAPTKAAAEEALLELEQKWGEKYPMVINSWTNNREELSAYLVLTSLRGYTSILNLLEELFILPILLKDLTVKLEK